MNANELADEVPLVELLENVPKDARFVQEEEFSSTYHPVGRLCHEAAFMLRQFGLAESIIKQQQLEIEALKDEVAKWKMSYENSIRFEEGYGHN